MASTKPESELHAIARTRIKDGTLPREVPPAIIAGYGSGNSCGLCDYPITPTDVEYEVQKWGPGGGASYSFHISCQSIWLRPSGALSPGLRPLRAR